MSYEIILHLYYIITRLQQIRRRHKLVNNEKIVSPQ